jgi:hypothetical protein
MTEPSRLLAGRRRLSRPEKDAILAGVLARVAPRSRWRHRLAIGALAIAGASAVVIAMLPGPPRDELTARGGLLPAGFDVTCVPAPCTAGSKLVFDITSTGTATGGDAGYFAAFARSADRWIWYFPAAPDGRSRALPRGGGVLDTGIILGPEHAPGSYTIHGVFSPVPLDRAAIRAIVDGGGATVARPVTIR